MVTRFQTRPRNAALAVRLGTLIAGILLPVLAAVPVLAHAQALSLEAPEITAAKHQLAENKPADADATLRSYLSMHLASAEARYLLAFALFRENKPKESLAEYTHAAALRQPTATDLRYVALDYVLLNDYADADTWLTRAVAANPEDSETWYSLGRVKSTENRFEDALECFRKALALSPQSAKIENNIGVADEGLNRNDEAVAAYRQAIAWEAKQPHPSEQPFLNLGIVLTNRNRLDEALLLLKQAEALAPKDNRVHGELGRLYQRRGELPAAQGELEQAVAITPDSAPLHFQLGQVYRKEGLAEKAKTELSRAAALDATHSTPDGPQ